MKLAADANVVLSALVGGAAGRVFQNPEVEVYTARQVISEIEEYIPRFAAWKGLDEALLRITLTNIPLAILEPEQYKAKLKEAERRIGQRDPDDVDLLAVALALRIPVWSNDNDFEDARVQWYTTAEILKKLSKK